MAGVKGRSGGARPGAGRKAKPPATTGLSDSKAFLEGVLKGEIQANPAQIIAARALLPFQHPKLGETGKKDQAKENAKKVSSRFTAAAPPRLAAAGGKKV